MSLNSSEFLELSAAAAALSLVGPGIARAQSGDDVIRIGIAANGPRTSDPTQTTQGPDNWATEQMYEQRVRPEDGDFATTPDKYIPTLATEWTTSDDAKTWNFKLRPSVQFHKGYGEMTSDDVVFTYKKAIDDGTNKTIM